MPCAAPRIPLSSTWAKTWNDANGGDRDNSHVVRVNGTDVWLGGRAAIQTADTTAGDGFLLKLDAATGAYGWGGFYYTGKAPGDGMEHRVKGMGFDASGDLHMLLQGYTGTNNFENYAGYWFDLMDDPLADLTLGEDPGDGGVRMSDYALTLSDVAGATFVDAVGSWDGTNTPTAFTIDTTSIWQAPPSAVTLQTAEDRTGGAYNADLVIQVLDL